MNWYYGISQINVHCEEMGDDLCVTICGGDRPHIGSVAVAEPRPSLTGNGNTSSTVSTYNFVGHKDNEVANVVAQEVASTLQRRTVVVCGIHYNIVNAELFQSVTNLTGQIIRDIVSYHRKNAPS